MPATNNGAQPLAPDAKRWGPRLINAHVLGEGRMAQKFTGIPVYGRLNNSTPLKSLEYSSFVSCRATCRNAHPASAT